MIVGVLSHSGSKEIWNALRLSLFHLGRKMRDNTLLSRSLCSTPTPHPLPTKSNRLKGFFYRQNEETESSESTNTIREISVNCGGNKIPGNYGRTEILCRLAQKVMKKLRTQFTKNKKKVDGCLSWFRGCPGTSTDMDLGGVLVLASLDPVVALANYTGTWGGIVNQFIGKTQLVLMAWGVVLAHVQQSAAWLALIALFTLAYLNIKNCLPSRQLVYVFLDNSNIFIGAQDRDGSNPKRLDFDDLILYFQQRKGWFWRVAQQLGLSNVRAVGEAHLHGSVPPGNDKLWERARKAGFKVRTLRRVEGKEQAVDDTLHKAMGNCCLEHGPSFFSFGPRPVIILASGDGNDNEGHGGFPNQLELALKHGFDVEVYSWKRCLSPVFRKMQQSHPYRLRVFLLDTDQHLFLFNEKRAKKDKGGKREGQRKPDRLGGRVALDGQTEPCAYCKRRNHNEQDCHFRADGQTKACSYCKKVNHDEQDCHFRPGLSSSENKSRRERLKGRVKERG
eukprot:g34559.t1